MSSPIKLRSDFDAAKLRACSCTCTDSKQVRRLLSLAAIYDGENRENAARIGGMTRQTLRDWVHRFNAQGIEGLVNHKACGPPSKLSRAEKQALFEIVKEGANLERDGVTRYRLEDLVRIVEDKFQVKYEISSMWRLLKSLNFSHISGRPQHPKSDEDQQAAFRQNFPPHLTENDKKSTR